MQTTPLPGDMRRASWNARHVWLTAFLVFSVAIAGFLAKADEAPDGVVALRVGEVGEPLGLIAGIDKGFFAQNRLAVKTVPLSGGPALISATIGGSTDLNYGDVFSWAAAVNNGSPRASSGSAKRPFVCQTRTGAPPAANSTARRMASTPSRLVR